MTAIKQAAGENWTLFNGDCCQVVKDIPDKSIDFCIHSPPFSTLYIYSDSEADMGNCASNDEFIEHYKFLIRDLHRVTVVGRLCAVHCKDLPKYANRDDTAGLIDFPGMIVDAYEACGWSYHSRVTIWKCPVTERERTNNNGLLHKTILRDRSQVRQGMADYLLVFRRPPVGTLMSDKPITQLKPTGERDKDGNLILAPVGFDHFIGDSRFDPRTSTEHPSKYARKHSAGKQSIDIWRRYAEPVWWDIDQQDVLNYQLGRDADDERHICPLQLGVIERATDIWSLPGEVVLSPFAGVGSEGVGALRQGRKFIGVELKESYFERACRELADAEEAARQNQRTLFDGERERGEGAEAEVEVEVDSLL